MNFPWKISYYYFDDNYSIPLLQNEYKTSVNKIVETTYTNEPHPPTPLLTALVFEFLA